jgi:hypothetical protein
MHFRWTMFYIHNSIPPFFIKSGKLVKTIFGKTILRFPIIFISIYYAISSNISCLVMFSGN